MPRRLADGISGDPGGGSTDTGAAWLLHHGAKVIEFCIDGSPVQKAPMCRNIADGGISLSPGNRARSQRSRNVPATSNPQSNSLPMDHTSSSTRELSHDATAARAREIWYARNCPTGQDEEIWLEAERQLAAERQARAGSKSKTESGTAVDIDQKELADRLDDFGEARPRSATSIDPTR